MPLMVGSNKLWLAKELFVGCVLITIQENMHAFTFSQDFWDLCVAGTEGAVDLEAISIIQE